MGVDRFFLFFDRVYSRVIYYGRIKNKDFYDGNKWKNIYIKQSFNCFYLFFSIIIFKFRYYFWFSSYSIAFLIFIFFFIEYLLSNLLYFYFMFWVCWFFILFRLFFILYNYLLF